MTLILLSRGCKQFSGLLWCHAFSVFFNIFKIFKIALPFLCCTVCTHTVETLNPIAFEYCVSVWPLHMDATLLWVASGLFICAVANRDRNARPVDSSQRLARRGMHECRLNAVYSIPCWPIHVF